MVDDEARCVLRGDGRVAHVARELGKALAGGGIGLETGDHLDHLHQRHGVEEVVARKAVRGLERRADGGDRQRRGIGGQHGGARHDDFQLREQLALDVQALDDGLDHQITLRQVVQRRHGLELGGPLLHFGRVDLALFCKALPLLLDLLLRSRSGFGVGVEEVDLAARLCGDLCNATAHGTGANDADLRESSGGAAHATIMAACASPCVNPQM
ncbi:hypothetical protein SDC9_148626 [bioreactor metagenome]|uniref:Uncharacterized protein n=1 Tax=bioreactor metagenome TaxID=1076179 RepID=A0A645EI35_9ZZZZ